MKNKSSLFLHAFRMMVRNIKSYAMLSVTIVLSFSILLGYMAFTDSTQYNEYKEVFAAPREVLMSYTYALDKESQLQGIISAAKQADPEAEHYRYYELTTSFPQYQVNGEPIRATVTVLPASGLPLFAMERLELGNSATQVFPTAGVTDFSLNKGEVMVNEDFYYALGGTGEFPLEIQLPVEWKDGERRLYTVQIVGLIPDHSLYTEDIGASGTNSAGMAAIVMTEETLEGRTVHDLGSARQILWFCSESPEAVYAPLNAAASAGSELSMPVHCVNRIQNQARAQIRQESATKAVICAFLFLLLGVNLYSSFSNALADRKFEIGVKRALGASSWSIVCQFLTEGILVMLGNTALSALTVVDLLCLYKLYNHVMLGETWTIQISVYSVAMFLVCSLTLTVVFSGLFAYKSTRVEIIQYLKAE